MIARISLASAALALCFGLSVTPAAFAAEDGGAMAKPAGGAMMHKDSMKEQKKPKGSMMGGSMMKQGSTMKKDETPPAQ